MLGIYAYPAGIERDEDSRYVVTFPDFRWGATDGATRDETLFEAKNLLREFTATTIREDWTCLNGRLQEIDVF